MDFDRFALFNFLGAVVWVAVISSLGYLFGSQWKALMHALRDADLVLLAVVVVIVLIGGLIRSRRRK